MPLVAIAHRTDDGPVLRTLLDGLRMLEKRLRIASATDDPDDHIRCMVVAYNLYPLLLRYGADPDR